MPASWAIDPHVGWPGADVNATDTFYRFRAIDLALMNNHRQVAAYLLERGWRGAANAYSMNEVIMATPAISDGTIIIRTLGHLYGIGAHWHWRLRTSPRSPWSSWFG